jgi:DNA-binding MarR family transcriptional regulator
MTKTLNRLEDDGLIRRRTDRGDRRALLVELTAKGLKSVGALLDQTLKGYAEAFTLDSGALKDLIRALRATLTTLENATGTEPTDVWVNIDRA